MTRALVFVSADALPVVEKPDGSREVAGSEVLCGELVGWCSAMTVDLYGERYRVLLVDNGEE